jgi:hypothetical protein
MMRVVLRSETEIRGLLIRTAAAAARDAEEALRSNKFGEKIRATQYREAEGALHSRLAVFWRSYGNLMKAAEQDAIAAAIQANINWDRVLLDEAAPTQAVQRALRKSLRASAERSVRLMLDRYTHATRPLSEKVYQTRALADGWVDDRINMAIGRGLSAREFAAQVRDLIRPDTRGGVSYAAIRLARTEINNANHFAAVQDQVGKPYLLGMQWNRSRSHTERDICDLLAESKDNPYSPGKVPDKPHPNCFCYVVPKTIDEDDFVDNFRSGKYDNYLSEKYGI